MPRSTYYDELGLQEVAVAMSNYASFHRLPEEAVTVAHVAKTFGRISGWAFLSATMLPEETLDASADEESALSTELPSSVRKLARVLRETRFDASLEAIALRNFIRFHRRDARDTSLGAVAASPQGVIGWAMPTFSIAQENYEAFRKMDRGTAHLEDVIRSSAGIFGWAAYRDPNHPSPLLSPSRRSGRPLIANRSSDGDSTECSENDVV